MTDLQTLRKLLKKDKDANWGDWPVAPDKDCPKAEHVLAFGCPDGQGAYLQALFDKKGKMLEIKILNPGGEECDCKWCKSGTGY
jgi:hypothetical protein